MSSNALLWPSQGTIPEQRFDKYKWLKLPSQGVGGVGTLLLDKFPGAVVGYSLRLLRTLYEGFAIRVIRTSDDAEQDIGFTTEGDLDIVALQAFVGSSDGLVKILYDQSGNAVDLDAQTDTDRLPKIIIAGVLQTSNGLPAALFDGDDDVLFSTKFLKGVGPDFIFNFFIFMVLQRPNLNEIGIAFNLIFPFFTTTLRVTASIPIADGRILWDAGNIGADRLATPLSIYKDVIRHQYTFTKTAGVNNQKIKRDNIQIAEQSIATTGTIIDHIGIGDVSSVVIQPYNMNFQEFVFYDTEILDDVPDIELDQIDYWITNFLITDTGARLITDTGDFLVID